MNFCQLIVKNGKCNKKWSVVSVSDPVTHRGQGIVKIMKNIMFIQMTKS